MRLTQETYEAVQGLAWTADGREIIYGAKSGLWRIPGDGGTPLPIPEVAGLVGFPCVSPRGGRLLSVAFSKPRNLWRFPGPRSTESERIASLLIGSAHADWNADFSPDGTQLAFQSLRSGGVYGIWVSDADGQANLRQLTFRDEHSATPRWSPDGEWIAFDSAVEETGMDIFVVRASGGTPRQITAAPSYDAEPSWAPDGTWLYFRSDRSGQDQIWKIPIEEGVVTGEPIPITRNGGRFPRAAPDGRSVYYGKKGASGIWKVPADGGEEALILDRKTRPQAWDPAEGGLYFIEDDNSIAWLEIETGEVTSVLQREQDCYGLVVSPDEKWIVWGEQGRGQADIMLMEDFQ
jgi:Tol biopolymer transport system component